VANEAYTVGVDFGTSSLKIVVAKPSEEDSNKIQVLSLVEVDSAGIKRGIITNMSDATVALVKALEQTENIIGLPVRRAVFGVNGSGIGFVNSTGLVINTRTDGEISESDVDRLVDDARKKAFGINDSEILHIIPKNYRIDNQSGIRNPIGMIGKKLESNILLISIESSFLRNFTKVVEQSGVEMIGQIYPPLASSDFLLTLSQKRAGTVMIDIGSASTSFIVWENEEIITTGTIPIGSDHITADLAVGLQTTIEMADEVKKKYIDLSNLKERELDTVEIHNPDTGANESFDLREAELYARARVEEMFVLLNKELKKIGKQGNLAGGGVLVGGGANLTGMLDIAKSILKIPVFKYKFDPTKIDFVPDYNGDPTFVNAISLVSYYLRQEGYADGGKPKSGFGSFFKGGASQSEQGVGGFFKNLFKR
jgi:cell division protein FtsA